MSSSSPPERITATGASSSSPLQRLPGHLAIEIPVRVAATSTRPMEDLRSMRASCTAMHDACKAKGVGRCLPLGLVLDRALINNNVGDVVLFRDTLIDRLAALDNPEACLRAGLREIFGANHGSLQPCLEKLKTAADAGHKPAAYMRVLCLYKRNSGAGDDAEAMRLIHHVEGQEDAGTPTPWKNHGCVWCCLDTIPLAQAVPALYDANGCPIEVPVAKPMLHHGLQCAGDNCGYPTSGWRFTWEIYCEFCSEECRMNSECECFFNAYF